MVPVRRHLATHCREAAVVSDELFRLLIVTPWSGRSAIGRVNLLVARELVKRGVSVSVIRSETDEVAAQHSPLSTEVPVLSPAEGLRLKPGFDFDAVCYAIGDHFPFHGQGLALLAEMPGVVMLHDVYLGHLAAGWASAGHLRGGEDRLRRLFYGELPPAGADLTWLAAHQPLTEWPMAMATGGIVHAQHYRERAAAACPGRVAQAPLPADDMRLPPPRARQPSDTLTLVTVGHVNRNKLAHEVIRAIGSSPRLRSLCRYRLLGPVEDSMRGELSSLAADLGVSLEMTGWLEEERLRREIAAADAIVCLRRPILEGGSMSAIVALQSARPTMVCDAGAYGEIPDALALKVPADPSIPDIANGIRRMLDEPAACQEMGRHTRAWVLETCTASRYVDSLLSVVKDSLDTSFTVSSARKIYAEGRRWGLLPRDDFFDRMAGVAASLFATEKSANSGEKTSGST